MPKHLLTTEDSYQNLSAEGFPTPSQHWQSQCSALLGILVNIGLVPETNTFPVNTGLSVCSINTASPYEDTQSTTNTLRNCSHHINVQPNWMFLTVNTPLTCRLHLCLFHWRRAYLSSEVPFQISCWQRPRQRKSFFLTICYCFSFTFCPGGCKWKTKESFKLLPVSWDELWLCLKMWCRCVSVLLVPQTKLLTCALKLALYSRFNCGLTAHTVCGLGSTCYTSQSGPEPNLHHSTFSLSHTFLPILYDWYILFTLRLALWHHHIEASILTILVISVWFF